MTDPNGAFETLVLFAIPFLLGFIGSRVWDFLAISGARMRVRMAKAELNQALAETKRATRDARLVCELSTKVIDAADASQRQRATLARELAEAAGIGSDRDWLGKKSDVLLFGDQTDAIAPERGSES